MIGTMRQWVVGAALVAGLAALAQAQTNAPPTAPTDAPAGARPEAAAPPLPKADDTNAERAHSQPGNNAPLWRAARNSGNVEGFTTLPGEEKGVLIQRFVQYPGSTMTTAGEAWRQVRNRWIIPYGGSLLLIMAVALALFYWRKGALGGHHAETGRKIERFTPFERAAHWTNATAFVVLAVSGLVMAFGKFFLLPVIGGTLFGWLTYALKTLHNFVGPLFVVSLVVVFLTFLRDNLLHSGDVAWLRGSGAMLRGQEEVPSHRFNAGEKVVFWLGVFLLGFLAVGSGLVLDKLVPVVDFVRGNMQIAHMVHASAAVLMMTLFLLHIYLGTLGMKGAYRGMRHGYVDEAWAREHHALWADDVRAGKIPAQRSKTKPPGGMLPAKEGA